MSKFLSKQDNVEGLCKGLLGSESICFAEWLSALLVGNGSSTYPNLLEYRVQHRDQN